MSVLSGLKLTVAKSRNLLSPIQHRRNKLVGRIDEQIKLAAAMRDGKSYAPTRTRIVKNKETGESRSVEQVKRVRAWWFSGEKGKCYVQVKYGTKTLELGKGKNSVELAGEGELVSVFETIKRAVEAGELDEQLKSAAAK